MSFDRLGLSSELLHAVADQGYVTPTPVQAAAIPLILAGRDVLAGAQTGTGKTAAFVLPILDRLRERPVPRPDPGSPRPANPRQGRHTGPSRPAMPVRVLVLVPTRELALQVEEAVRTYGARRPVRSVPIYGGVGYEPQYRALRRGVDVVVATPGRLIDHLEQGMLDLSGIEVLVLDEADRMLDMGFIRDIRRIVAKVPGERQTLLFSATFSNAIRQLATSLLRDPAPVDVAPRNTPAELVRHLVIRVDRDRKRHLLTHLVGTGRVDQALVFTRTKHGANRLAQQLEMDGIRAAAIHGNRSQAQRIRALNDFKSGRVALLVATEVAARGIDIDALPHVVNYELPMVPEDYIHRIGRTGRAGSDGDAISLVCVDEAPLLRDIEALLGRAIAVETVAGFEPDPRTRPEPIRLRSGGGPARTGPARTGPVQRRSPAGPPRRRPARPGHHAPRPHQHAARPDPHAPRPRPHAPRPKAHAPRPNPHAQATGRFTALPGERFAPRDGGPPPPVQRGHGRAD